MIIARMAREEGGVLPPQQPRVGRGRVKQVHVLLAGLLQLPGRRAVVTGARRCACGKDVSRAKHSLGDLHPRAAVNATPPGYSSP